MTRFVTSEELDHLALMTRAMVELMNARRIAL